VKNVPSNGTNPVEQLIAEIPVKMPNHSQSEDPIAANRVSASRAIKA